MIKHKIYTWLIQSVVIFLFLSIYWGEVTFSFLVSFAGIILIPFSLLSEYLTKRLSLGFRLALSFVIHTGVSIVFFLSSQGWILSILYGLLYWIIDEVMKLRQKDN